nr:MAG TPA: hypothetical protein [Caudoviricetes sp.]
MSRAVRLAALFLCTFGAFLLRAKRHATIKYSPLINHANFAFSVCKNTKNMSIAIVYYHEQLKLHIYRYTYL